MWKAPRGANARTRVAAPRAEKRPPPSSSTAAAGTAPEHAPASTLSPGELAARLDVARSTGRLDLSECGLTRVPDAVALLGAGLEDLSLAGNPALAALPEWLGEALPSLARLQAAGCGLRSLPASIAGLTRLRGLWAHGCALEALPDGIGELAGSLRSLSLAGNRLRELPASVGRLSSLEEAGLAGNRLRRLPKEVGGLESLRKLQLHGNLLGLAAAADEREEGGGRVDGDDDAALVAAALAALPEEALAPLLKLTHVTLQGNFLARLPECLGSLPLLEDLNVADNRLLSLPRSLAAAPSLRRLTSYGNRIRSLPPLLARAPSLRGLWLEGNPLCHPSAATAAAAAATAGGEEEGKEGQGGNGGGDGGEACSLAAGRELHALLVDASRASARGDGDGSGSSGGAEPFSSSSPSSSGSGGGGSGGGGAEADAASAEGADGARRRRVGLDARQLASLEPAVVAAAAAGGVLAPPCATLCGSKRGYWKLEAGPGGGEWVAEVAERAERAPSSRAAAAKRDRPPPAVVDGSGAEGRRGLVVAFGSAPGEPNWGGLLSRIRRNAADPAHARFDVLYVVDGARSWYNGGDAADGDEKEGGGSGGGGGSGAGGGRSRLSSPPCSFWTEPIAAAAEAYDGAVLLLGDSMGATGALLAAGAVAEACLQKRSTVAATASSSSSSPSSTSSPSSSASAPPSPRPRALAFCPQVDLAESSIRPAASAEWMARLRERTLASVSVATAAAAAAAAAAAVATAAQGQEGGQHNERGRASPPALQAPAPPAPMRVDVHVGSWRHDLAQALPLQSVAGAAVKVWAVPSHRLAAALDSRGELEPLVRSALLSVMGFSDGRGVRISNVL